MYLEIDAKRLTEVEEAVDTNTRRIAVTVDTVTRLSPCSLWERKLWNLCRFLCTRVFLLGP
jgi:hypothetical protein